MDGSDQRPAVRPPPVYARTLLAAPDVQFLTMLSVFVFPLPILLLVDTLVLALSPTHHL